MGAQVGRPSDIATYNIIGILTVKDFIVDVKTIYIYALCLYMNKLISITFKKFK